MIYCVVLGIYVLLMAIDKLMTSLTAKKTWLMEEKAVAFVAGEEASFRQDAGLEG